MKKQALFGVVVMILFAGCSHHKNVGTFSIVSAHTMPSSQRTGIVSGEFCGKPSSGGIAGPGNIYLFYYELYQNAIISALNKAKKQGLPADALINPVLTIDGGFTESCVSVTGKPVGLKLVQ